MECNSIIVTGDINFLSTDWKIMHSSDEYENDCLNLLTELNFEQVFDFRDLTGNTKQLDVFMVNEPQLWIESNIDNTPGNQYKIGNAKCSDHYPFRTKFFFSVNKSETIRLAKFALNNVDWQKLNEIVLERPFQPYCYSNIDELLNQWYRWFNKLLNENVPKVTTHRANLPPWISK